MSQAVAEPEASTKPEEVEEPAGGIWWIAGYPKSGNTWMRAFLTAYELGVPATPTELIGMQDVSAYWNEAVCPFPAHQRTLRHEYLLRPAAILHMRAFTPRPLRLWVKTHNVNGAFHDARLIPRGLCDGSVYVVRDPRSIVASWAAHMGDSIEESITAMLDSNRVLRRDEGWMQILGRWDMHAKSWYSNADNLNCLVVRYEDMVEDTEATFRTVVKHCYGGVEEEYLHNAIEYTSFENMKRMEQKFGFMERPEAADRFFRRGKTDWKPELKRAHARRIEREFGEVMEDLGYL